MKSMKKRIENRIDKNKINLVKMLELPKDALLGEAIVTLTGNNEALIGNYKGLIEYRDNYIRVLTHKGIVEVIGKQLFIPYLTKDEIKVLGQIKDIKY